MLELTGICDVVVHLAAAVGVKLIIDEPLKSIHTNIAGTEIVLELANKFRKKTFLASTSEIYGRNSKVPLSEDDERIYGSTAVARWSYAATKAMDEFLALAYYRNKQLPGDRGPVLQHRRAAPDRALRHGRAALRGTGAAQRAADDLRHRRTDPHLHLRRGCGAGGDVTDRRAQRGGRDLQYRRGRRDLHQRSGQPGQAA